MNRARTSRILPLVLLLSAALWAAAAADANSTEPEAASGAYAVTFHVQAPSTVPDGATISCQARIAPQPTWMQHVTGQPASFSSAPSVGTVANSSADCTVMVPYDAAEQANQLSYHIDALTAAGPVFARAQQGINLMPAPGATQKLHLNVAL